VGDWNRTNTSRLQVAGQSNSHLSTGLSLAWKSDSGLRDACLYQLGYPAEAEVKIEKVKGKMKDLSCLRFTFYLFNFKFPE